MPNLKNNTTSLQNILKAVNNLPEAGVELPELSSEALATELLHDKELIDSEGNIVVGTMPNNGTINETMDGINTKSVTVPSGYTRGGTVSLDGTIDNEVDIQTSLLNQITTALEGKASVPSEDVDDETDAYTEKLVSLETAITALETELEGKASGGATIEAWTGTVYGNGGLGDVPNLYAYYTDENLVARAIVVYPREEATITIAANTYVIIYGNFEAPNIYDNTEEGTQRIGEYYNMTLYLPVKNNFTIS